ncbi:MAG: glycosyltransferase family 39 protein [Candidatus Omnitrophica bacterium]|nr:glycosyltransferase family 39 protein [Candidatus Omnitrophota bacterium]MCM8832395.1 glycosyltransferase family 39 protein [Candidatus Omnitrophota bacterium]
MEKKNRFLLFIIILTGILLRIFNIGKNSLWCDELLAISIGEHSIKWIIDYITYNDAHPPLFYILVHFWLKFGKSEFLLRTLPLIFGILTIPAGYYLGKKFKNEKTGLFLSIFISISPPLILWSQILKSYTMFIFLTLLSFYNFLDYLENKNQKKLINLVILNTLILYTHNFGFIIILIQTITLGLLKNLDKKFIFSNLMTFILYIPWLIKIPYQLKFTLGVRRPIPMSLRLPYTIFYFFLGESINPFNIKILIPTVILYLILLPSCLNGISYLNKSKRILISTSIIIPILFAFFRSTVPQNLISFSFFWYLFFSLGIERKNIRNPVNFLVFLCFFPSLFYYYSGNTSQYHDPSKLIPFREIYKEIKKLERVDDLIITTENCDKDILAPIQWYYKGKNKIIEIEDENDLKKIYKYLNKYERFFLTLDYVNRPEISDKIKEIFETNFKKIFEKKFIYNEKLLSKLKGKKEAYYMIEVYIFEKI